MNPANTKPYKLPDNAVWLITGCSSGIGRALATLVASKPNHRLIATARNPADLAYLPDGNPNILKLPLDVTSPESVNGAFAAAAEHFSKTKNGGRFYLDVVVNNAGYSLSGDTESATEEETHREMETLFFGTARVTTRAIEAMRQQAQGKGEGQDARGGVIFNISSLAGLCAFAGHAYYHAGKFAVEGFSESVAREVHPDWGINVCIVEPSGVKTNFEGHSKARTAAHPAYVAPDMPARKLEMYVNMGIKSGVGMMDPAAVADALYTVASRGERVPLRLPLGATAWKMGKAKFEGLVRDFEEVKGISVMGQQL